MVERNDKGFRAYQGIIVNGDADLILKLANRVDKYAFANGDVFTKVCVKGWKEVEVFAHWFANKF